MKTKALYLFGDIVVVHENLIGVILKTWERNNTYEYEVYVRVWNRVCMYQEKEIERYRVRHKYLDDEEVQWQNG